MIQAKFKIGDVVKLKYDVCEPCNKFIIREIIITQDEVWYGFTGGMKIDEKHLEICNAYAIKRNSVTLSVYDTLDEAKESMRNYVEAESMSLIEREYYKVSVYRTEKTAVIVFFEQLGAEKQIVTYGIWNDGSKTNIDW